MRLALSLVNALVLLVAVPAFAETETEARFIKIIGRKAVTVTTPTVRLGDLAEISSSRSSDDDAVIGLQKIFVENSPRPGADATVSASYILERLTSEGVDLQKLSYSLPRVISVKRASRAVTKDEVRIAIETALHVTGMDAALKDIRYNEDRYVAPGASTIEAIPLNMTSAGVRPFTIKVAVEGQEQQVFDVKATVDEWAVYPVAKNSVPRGMVVQPADVAMARVNLATIPVDALHGEETIVGLAASKDIPAGEVFRRDKLAIPPLITSGSRVTMMYRNGLFEASASGIALESGVQGQEIKVRNDSSKKIITGTVLEPGLVGVRP